MKCWGVPARNVQEWEVAPRPEAFMPRTIEIPVSDDVLRRLDEKAQRSGLKREDYVSALLSKDLAGPSHVVRSSEAVS